MEWFGEAAGKGYLKERLTFDLQRTVCSLLNHLPKASQILLWAKYGHGTGDAVTNKADVARAVRFHPGPPSGVSCLECCGQTALGGRPPGRASATESRHLKVTSHQRAAKPVTDQ